MPGGLSEDLLAGLAADAGFTDPSIVVRRLTAPTVEASLEPNRPLYPASMIKLPLAAALWARADLRPDACVAVTAANMTVNDAASPLEPGYGATLEQLADLMLTRSDNVATNVLIDVLGRENATEFARSIGLAQTAVRRKLSGSEPLIDDPQATGRNTHPAGDSAFLLQLIDERRLRGAEWLRATLARQEWNEKLPRGLRNGDRFAHKTGDTDEVTHNGGILDTAEGLRYIVVVYTSLPTSPPSDARMAAFMSALRPLL